VQEHVFVYYLYRFCLSSIFVLDFELSLNLTAHTSLSPIQRGFAPSFLNDKKGCTQLAAASDKDYQLVAQGRCFSPASSTTKIGRHDIAESGVKHQKFKFKCIVLIVIDFYWNISLMMNEK
jgi:hypothetical protein